MCCHLASQPVRIRYDGLHLLQGVLRRLRIVTLRQHAPRRANLDQVGAVLDVVANHVLHCRNPVRHTLALHVILLRQQVLIHVAAGNSQRRPGHQHVWPGNVSCVDLVAQRDIREAVCANVAYGRETRVQRRLRILYADNRFLGGRHRQLEIRIEVGGPREVRVSSISPGITVYAVRSTTRSPGPAGVALVAAMPTILSR